MDYAALFAAGVAGLAIGGGVSDLLNRKLIAALRGLVKAHEDTLTAVEATRDMAVDHLTALRRNCFLTDTDGVRRRYDKVSRAVRERAEGN